MLHSLGTHYMRAGMHEMHTLRAVFPLDAVVRQGTGSYQSRLEKGWQRQIRLKAIQPPFQAPYLEMACTAYSEQVGR